MTKNEALALYETRWWEHVGHFERAAFQLFEDRLCLPFGEFHKSVEAALGRPVFTHEFAVNREGLQQELLGERQAPTLDEILAMIPEEKRIVVVEGSDAR